ncbi:MAG: SDR family oxidoreductase, partial [Marmoricola sp.]|nr:SDR family oxidoreductase [Marmoricola sp.]
MAYFVTGATGFIGRYLVEELLANRQGEVYVLCRESSLPRIEALIAHWDDEYAARERVTTVVGDL